MATHNRGNFSICFVKGQPGLKLMIYELPLKVTASYYLAGRKEVRDGLASMFGG
jgi:hypothetical protein